jgi:hypothetical protein
VGVPERSIIMGYRDEQLYTLLCARYVAGSWFMISNGEIATMLNLANARQGSRYAKRLFQMGLVRIAYQARTVRAMMLVPQDVDMPWPKAGDIYELTTHNQETADDEQG